MIEFTLSRAVLCVCGVSLLAVAAGFCGIVNDGAESDMNQDLADAVADLLDRFQESAADEIVLTGADLLPSASHTLRVADHVVTVEHDGRSSKAYTDYPGSFELGGSGEITVSKGDVGSRTSPRCA